MRRHFRTIAIGILVIVCLVGTYNVYRPLPEPVDFASEIYPVPDEAVTFLADRTYQTKDGERQYEHEIFDTIAMHIATADSYILADMFLWNDALGQASSSRRTLAHDLSTALARRASETDAPQIYTISDPINTAYGSYTPTPLQTLHEAHIPLIITDLSVLRDSNPVYSAWYRTLLQHVPDIGGNWLPNPFDSRHTSATISGYFRGLNFKANHRKLLLTDHVTADGIEWRTLVTSLNPHDGSSSHSNVGLVVTDALARQVLTTEAAVADFSSQTSITPHHPPRERVATDSDVAVQLLTERAIKRSALARIAALETGDSLQLQMFYLSDRDIIGALKAADTRGVTIDILLDPNRDAFGREKSGIPNRPVAHELMQHTDGNTTIRWCVTNGEQCHSKLLLTKTDSTSELLLGSANFTRRNLNNYNLETNLRVIGTSTTSAIRDATEFFSEHWTNANGRQYSTNYDTYADTHLGQRIWYRIGEFTGISHY